MFTLSGLVRCDYLKWMGRHLTSVPNALAETWKELAT